MPTLYILCGPSGCGKSTWSDQFMQDHDVRYVSRDEIRYSLLKEDEDYFAHEGEVFRTFVGTLAQTLIDGFDVIADATHLNQFSRQKLTRAIDNYIMDYNIVYVVFYTSYEDCCTNNNKREGRERVPIETIQSMCRTFKAPTNQEDSRVTDIIEINKGEATFGHLIAPYRKVKVFKEE